MPDDQPEIRTHGLQGVKRRTVPDQNVTANFPPPDPSLPASYSATHGMTKYGMQGNATWGNCVWAFWAHAWTIHALTGLDEKGHPIFIEGATIPHPNEAVEWYKGYLKANHLENTTPPGAGTDPYAAVTFALANGLALWAGVLGPDSQSPSGTPDFTLEVINQAIYDFKGGVGICLCLDPDAFKEFDDHVPWGTDSIDCDAEEGHCVDGVGYVPALTDVITWAEIEGMTDQMDTTCVDGLILVITKNFVLQYGEEEAQRVASLYGLTPAEAVPTSVIGDDTGDILHELERAIESVPNHIKEAVKVLHKIGDAALDREAVAVLQQLFKDFLKTYTHGAL